MAKNVYIHIPFCKGKCNYCSFISFDRLDLKEEYHTTLVKQIKCEYKGEMIETLYFGGGTPSLLSIDEFESLIRLFNLENNAEITAEVNPDSVSKDYSQALREIGVNRLSIGVQTFDDSILKVIGRLHNAKQIESAVNFAKDAGFNNINLDLIYGLPEQTLESFKVDLDKAIDLDVQHISLYGLKIEEGCYFYKNEPNDLPNSDIQADMYLMAVEILKNAYFNHYEISNFAKAGFESRHNLNYWNNNTYYGFGCAASGYINNIRYTNEMNLDKYIKNPLLKISEQKLTKHEILEEAIFLGFRKIAGINIEEINQKFGIDFNNKYSKILNKYSKFFIQTQNGYALTLDGILISNEILSEFIGCC